jgi:Mrp family chromosome partitioning ATPase
MVTSPIAHTGSSFTANNLAIVASEYGLKTLLIDMNLREPQLHEDFALTNKYGVADLLNMLIDHPELLDDPEEQSLFINWPLQHSAAYPNLSLMCTGTNPDRVVGQLPELDLLRDYFALMVSELDYDLIIMSGASTDNTSDSYNIIAQTQAAPLLVLSSSNTEVDDVWRVLEQFKRRRLEVHGMILNDVF